MKTWQVWLRATRDPERPFGRIIIGSVLFEGIEAETAEAAYAAAALLFRLDHPYGHVDPTPWDTDNFVFYSRSYDRSSIANFTKEITHEALEGDGHGLPAEAGRAE